MEVLARVFSHYGMVEQLVYIAQMHKPHVLVQYQTYQMAMQAAGTLQGRWSPEAYCQLEIQFAMEDELQIFQDYALEMDCQSAPSVCDACHNTAVPQREECLEKRSTQLVQDNIPVFNVVVNGTLEHQQHDGKKIERTADPKPILSDLIAEWEAYKEKSKKRELESQRKREQEELQRELDYFMYHAFDLSEEATENKVGLEKNTSNTTVIIDHFIDVAASHLNVVLSNNLDVPRECLTLYQQLLIDPEKNASYNNKQDQAREIENMEINAADVLSSLQEVIYDGKMSLCPFNFGKWVEQMWELLLRGIADFPLVGAIEIVADEPHVFKNEKSVISHWDFRETSLHDFKLYGKSEKITQLEVIQKELLLTEREGIIAENDIELGYSQSEELMTLPQQGTIDEELTMPWDPGDQGERIREILLLLQSVTLGVKLTLPWDPGEQDGTMEFLKLSVNGQVLRKEESKRSEKFTIGCMQIGPSEVPILMPILHLCWSSMAFQYSIEMAKYGKRGQCQVQTAQINYLLPPPAKPPDRSGNGGNMLRYDQSIARTKGLILDRCFSLFKSYIYTIVLVTSGAKGTLSALIKILRLLNYSGLVIRNDCANIPATSINLEKPYERILGNLFWKTHATVQLIGILMKYHKWFSATSVQQIQITTLSLAEGQSSRTETWIFDILDSYIPANNCRSIADFSLVCQEERLVTCCSRESIIKCCQVEYLSTTEIQVGCLLLILNWLDTGIAVQLLIYSYGTSWTKAAACIVPNLTVGTIGMVMDMCSNKLQLEALSDYFCTVILDMLASELTKEIEDSYVDLYTSNGQGSEMEKLMLWTQY